MQFAAVPWLRGYLNGQIAQIVDSAELDLAIVAQMLQGRAPARVIEAVTEPRGVDHRLGSNASAARNRRSGHCGDVAA